jgi:hypothetical protein
MSVKITDSNPGFDGMQERLAKMIQERITKKLGPISCPQHGPADLRVVVTPEQSTFDVKVEGTSCCDALRQAVDDRVASLASSED